MRPRDRFSRAVVCAALLAASAALASHDARAQDSEPDDDPHAQAPNPHGGQQQGGPAGMFEPPPDVTDEDPRAPAGSIAIRILDPDNVAMPDTTVTLGILKQSVAKGDSREHKTGTTDAQGAVSFAGLDTGAGIAYRVSVAKDGGTFAASPFQLPFDKGMRVQLHVYPVTNDVTKALIVSQLALFAEMKDDRVQLEEAITIFNLGRVAWVPKDVVVSLPEGFTAVSAIQTMGDEGIDPADKQGARLRGTFGPGQHPVQFRWQLPYMGEKDVIFDHGAPPNTAIARVLSAASQGMRLVVDGFPQAEPRPGPEGERLLVTEKQFRRDDAPITHIHVELRDLPTAGPARTIATVLAALGVLAGAVFAFRPRKASARGSTKDVRAHLLEDLEELERAHRVGDVGPATYERARRELIDAIARTLEPKEKDAGKARSKGREPASAAPAT